MIHTVKPQEHMGILLLRFFSARLETKFAFMRSYDDWWFKQFRADRTRAAAIKKQTLNPDDHVKYGSNVAVARFVLGKSLGKVKTDRGVWIDKFSEVPDDFVKDFKLTAIDASKSGLITEGVDNFVGLDRLESLDLSANPHLDDFACDQLARQFRKSKTLKDINLSRNPLISVHGLEILLRIPSLKRVTAIETLASKYDEIDLFTLAAEDERDCRVFVHTDGRQYISDELEELRLDRGNAERIFASNRS